MSEATPINLTAFAPEGGGQGVRLTVTTASTSSAIPGLAGGRRNEQSRVVVSNSGLVSAYVLIGRSGVQASTSSYEILPLTKEVLTPPYDGPASGGLFIAAITASGTTTINACAGTGT